MNQRTLTAAEQAYVCILAERQLHISRQVEALMHRPMQELHETGYPVIVVLSWLMEASGWTDLELCEALT